MRTLNVTEMRFVAGGVDPVPQLPPGPTCEPPQSHEEKMQIRQWLEERQMNEWFRSRGNH